MPDVLYDPHASEGYALFTLNRPERLNAISGSLMAQLEEAVRAFTADPAMRVGIVTGAGRAFSAGADLREGAERDAAQTALQARRDRGEITAAQWEEESSRGSQRSVPLRFSIFASNPKPFIAAVNGPCAGGAMIMALGCDIRIASTEASLALSEPRWGMAVGIGEQYFGSMVPFGEAMYMLLTGDQVNAQDAYRMGLVHQVLEPERLVPRAVEIAGMVARGAPLAIQATKALAQAWRRAEKDQLAPYNLDAITQVAMQSEDVKEGRRAFAEKRAPRWQGR